MTDRSGFDEFVHARGPALARTAYLLTGDHHLAEDLVQAALVQAARHWERIESSPEAYVRRTMYHQNISWWRRRKLAETPLESYDAAVPAADPTLRLPSSRPCAASPRASARCWCCATSRTSPRSRRPPSWA